MKKLLFILIGLIGCNLSLLAEHIKGGEMFYTYIGPGSSAGTSVYSVSLKLYIDCNANSSGQLDQAISLTVFNKVNNSQYGAAITAPFTGETFSRFDPASNPCIGNPPRDVCYRVRIYSATITLPDIPAGYVIAFQRCCRIGGIVNLSAPSNSAGATYFCEIPGTAVAPDAFKNSSPRFSTNDATAVCTASAFELDFSAEEPDGTDTIVYSLCSGFVGGSQTTPNPSIASTPPYTSLSYTNPYSGSSPLGASVTIDPVTGKITGKAPIALGQYVITACATEYRNGVAINVHKKDIHIRVSDCVPLRAFLKPDYAFCDDFLVTFKNEQNNPPGAVYTWDFGDNSGHASSTDPDGNITHQYADTGTYLVTLKVVLAGQCVDETTTLAKVYPGFYPGFVAQGTCLLLPIQFIDTTASRYGQASKWRWNFGDASTQADTSRLANPSWKFNSTGIKDVELIVESSKGCIDTISRQVEIRDKPPVAVAFKDTLICSIDTLQLSANGNGIFSWRPSPGNILNENTATPLVYPKQTTDYIVSLNENGCINHDTVRVRVVDFVTLNAGPAQTICLTDSVRLNPTGDGLKFSWTPTASLDNPNAKNPLAAPAATTTYQVTASIGKCSADGSVVITPIPYPVADAGNDTTICYGDAARINATMVGSRFNWSPISTLSNPSVLNPVANPRSTTKYVLQVYDTLGCPKPGVAEVTVNVRAEILAFAGNDTAVVAGQPLVLKGSGADLFEWSPSFGLDQRNVASPTAVLNDNATYIMRAFTEEGCQAFDTINVKVFKTQPDIFVPNAFNPAGTRNPVFRPVPVGISTLSYFRVYNRWGQLVFQTSQAGKGWDGMVDGKPQGAGAFVWIVSGVDYTGKTVTRRGTAVLIR
ncbi:MAG: PKD domain-containing protein [Sphingobacteriales bacterium]|nr:MAG: PKD domain-containing protein [Sphingobacteriales bacterium]